MKPLIFDRERHEKDQAARKIEPYLVSFLSSIDGLWLYREPEIKTEGDELPTYTIASPQFGLVFIKAYDYTPDDITEAKNDYWIISGKSVKSEFKRMRNYAHRIVSRITDPLLDLSDAIPVKTIYVFPYIVNNALFREIKIGRDEKLVVGTIEHGLDDIFSDDPISSHDYDVLINIIQNANIINKTSNVYVDEPAKNAAEAIVLNNNKISRFDYDQMQASLTITEKSERIRGLAGSGKTVLLAMKAAKLHKRFPIKK